MRSPFSQLVKDLRREATDLKTVRRLSTKTLQTQTKTIATWGTIKRENYSQAPIITGKAAYVTLNTTNPAPYMVALSSEEHRNYRIFNYADGVIVAPAYTADLDGSMALGSEKTVNFTVEITTTNSISLTATQMDMNS